jgi:hypothetical protein
MCTIRVRPFLGRQSTHGFQGYPSPQTRGSSDRPDVSSSGKWAINATNLRSFAATDLPFQGTPTQPQRNLNATSNGVELESNVRGHETFSLTIRGPLAPVVDHFSSREDVTLGTRSWEIRCDGPPADRPTQWDLGDSSLFIDICTYSTVSSVDVPADAALLVQATAQR